MDKKEMLVVEYTRLALEYMGLEMGYTGNRKKILQERLNEIRSTLGMDLIAFSC